MENIMYCILTAICFAIWPILINKSGAPNMAIATIVVMVTTLLPPIIYNQIVSQQKVNLPMKYIFIAATIGLVNGLGMIFYTKLINTPNTGAYVSTVAIIMPIFALIFGYIIIGQPTITITKIIGIVLAIIGVWLITK